MTDASMGGLNERLQLIAGHNNEELAYLREARTECDRTAQVVNGIAHVMESGRASASSLADGCATAISWQGAGSGGHVLDQFASQLEKVATELENTVRKYGGEIIHAADTAASVFTKSAVDGETVAVKFAEAESQATHASREAAALAAESSRPAIAELAAGEDSHSKNLEQAEAAARRDVSARAEKAAEQALAFIEQDVEGLQTAGYEGVAAVRDLVLAVRGIARQYGEVMAKLSAVSETANGFPAILNDIDLQRHDLIRAAKDMGRTADNNTQVAYSLIALAQQIEY